MIKIKISKQFVNYFKTFSLISSIHCEILRICLQVNGWSYRKQLRRGLRGGKYLKEFINPI